MISGQFSISICNNLVIQLETQGNLISHSKLSTVIVDNSNYTFTTTKKWWGDMHTWYLSRVPRVVPVEKNLSCGEIWPHDRFSCGQILHIADRHVDKFLTWQIIMWKKFSTWEMWRKFVMWRNNVSNLWCFVAFYAVLLQNVDLRSFVAISVLSRSTRFCVEKNSAKNYAPWRKND